MSETNLLLRQDTKNKLKHPKHVMVIGKGLQSSFVIFIRELARYLIDNPRDCSATGLVVFVDERLKDVPLFGYEALCKTYPKYCESIKFWTPNFCATNHHLIDFIITLGGDGTILYASSLFQNSNVPPIVPFHLGSLGFLAVFHVNEITQILDSTLGVCNQVHLNVRLRLACTVWRATSNAQSPAGLDQNTPRELNTMGSNSADLNLPDTDFETLDPPHALVFTESNSTHRTVNAQPTSTFHILNDVVVDRGPSAYMNQLELFVNGKHLTTSQADGLVISTPTGSTAYSVPDLTSSLQVGH